MHTALMIAPEDAVKEVYFTAKREPFGSPLAEVELNKVLPYIRLRGTGDAVAEAKQFVIASTALVSHTCTALFAFRHPDWNTFPRSSRMPRCNLNPMI